MTKRLLTKKQKRQLLYSFLSLLLAGIIWFGQKQGWLEEPLISNQLINQSESDESSDSKSNNIAIVTSVVDGDTIKVSINSKVETVRLIGVDTPETRDPRKPVQCFGEAATNFMKKLVDNKQVRLESDSQSSNRDRYNRLLRYVYLDEMLINSEIIKQGYGFAYTSFPFDKTDEFKNLEEQARQQNVGLWGKCPTT